MVNRMKKCFWDALVYEFDVEGHTVMRCKLGRKICPNYDGKCPALEPKEDNTR